MLSEENTHNSKGAIEAWADRPLRILFLCSEATIAKRRSYANTISYLTPPAENAGLYKGLKELKELIGSYQVGGAVEMQLVSIMTRKCSGIRQDDAAVIHI